MPAPFTSPHPNADAMNRRLAQLSQAMGEAPEPEAAVPTRAHARAAPPDEPAPLADHSAPPSRRRQAHWFWWPVGLAPIAGAWLLLHGEGEGLASPAVATPILTQAALPAQAAAPVTAQPADPGTDDAAVLRMLEQWRMDWSRQDVPAYLSHYSPRFEAADGMTRLQWEAHRRKSLLKRSGIRVELSQPRLQRTGPAQVRAQVLQTYLSAGYQETARPKTLLLALESGQWRIVGEWQDGGQARPAARP